MPVMRKPSYPPGLEKLEERNATNDESPWISGLRMVGDFLGVKDPNQVMLPPMTTVGPGAIPLGDYEDYVRKVAGRSLSEFFKKPISQAFVRSGKTEDLGIATRTMLNLNEVRPELKSAVPGVTEELTRRGEPGSPVSNAVVNIFSKLHTFGQDPKNFKP